MCESSEKPKEDIQKGAWLAFFAETNMEIRARRMAEYTYTAASVAAFGALAWGVASINPECDRQLPVKAAVVAIIIIVGSVFGKIIDEHFKHFRLRKEAIRLAKKITYTHGIDHEKEAPLNFKEPTKPGTGHLWSALVLELAGLGAILFCLSIGFPNILICAGIIGALLIVLSLLVVIIVDKIKTANGVAA